MTDVLTPEQKSRCMAAIRSKDTKPELAVRSIVHRLGYRFRLHRSDLPGKPDLVFHRGEKSSLYTAASGISIRDAVLLPVQRHGRSSGMRNLKATWTEIVVSVASSKSPAGAF